MRITASFLLTILYALVINAQPFVEDFDGTTPPFLPPGWTSHNLFGANGLPCGGAGFGLGDWTIIDEGTFAGCFMDPVTTSASTFPNFALIGDAAPVPPGDIVEDVLLTPVLTGLLDSSTYDIKFSLRRTDLGAGPTTATVLVKVQFLADDGDGIPEPGGDDGPLIDIAGISLVDGVDEPWAVFMEPWSPPIDDDYFIGWQALWTETGETGVCLDDVEISGGPPLPVELTSFTASVGDNNVTLKWITASELNNSGFDVLRSTKESVWEKIGFVAGFGTTTKTHNYSFTDENLASGHYAYRLKQVDFDGTYELSDVVTVDVTNPVTYGLAQNYPNPFNPNTTIKFTLAKDGNITLKVYNTLGQEVALLVNRFMESGIHEVNFEALNLNSGMYFYRIEAGDFTQVKKMTLLK